MSLTQVQQLFLMQWQFDGQPLQYGEHVTLWEKGLHYLANKLGSVYRPWSPKVRNRPLTVPVKYTPVDAYSFKLKATGAATFERLAFGKCYAVPRELESNCTAALEWYQKRAKDPVKVGGQFGNSNLVFKPDCAWIGSVYWNHIQGFVKPDEFTQARYFAENYCCCTDMRTG